MKQTKRDKLIDTIVFAVMLLAVSAVTLILFYRQTTGSPALYHSDMKAYILEMQGLDSGYEFPYPVFFKLSALIHLFVNPELAVAIATMLLNSLAIVLTKLAFNHLIFGGAVNSGEHAMEGRCDSEGLVKRGWLVGVGISFVTVSLFFVSMLFPPTGIYLPGIKYNYLGVFTPNPFHNATYMAARPFAILAFLWFVKLLPVYEGGLAKISGKPGSEFRAALGLNASGATLADYIMFSVFLLLATMTKPSFTLVLVSTAGLLMLYRLIRSRFRNFVPTVQFGLCFVPTFIDLLYQFKGVFMPDDGAEGGIGFCFGEVWAQYCTNLPLAICLAVGFPLAVLVCNFKECKKNTMFLFSWQLYAVSFAEAFFLYEKGFRKFDFNFSWGYICGIFFCHFAALVVLMRATVRAASGEVPELSGKAGGIKGLLQSRRVRTTLLVLQWLAYAWHLACGLYYFGGIFAGKMYY